MKAEEVLKRYQAGRRDFPGENLRGQSFKGKDLSGADFSHADIRGANFTKAIVKGANFSHAEAGLQNRLAIGLLIISGLLSVVSGIFSVTVVYSVALVILNSSGILNKVVTLIVLVALFILIIRKGLVAGSVAVAVAGSVAVASAEAFHNFFAISRSVPVASGVAGLSAFAFAGSVALFGFGAGFGAVAVASAVALFGFGAGFGAVAVASASALAGIFDFPGFKNSVSIDSGALAATRNVAVAGAFAITLLSAYISWRTLAGDKKHALIKNIAIAFAATGGTNFRGADLTDANFTKATLKNTDFRKAILTRTRFYKAEKLDFARLGDSILATQAVLRLLVSGNGRGKPPYNGRGKPPYVDANLRGANLKGYDLKKANLKNANISEATFEGACLEWANLTLTQAVGTNFTSAQMTGACVEAWNIEHTTILDNVDCRFIYLLEHPKPETDDRERRPSSGEFKSGEFTKLFQEVFDTVDLIFRNGIDWKAFVAAFKKLQIENEGIELVIQSIENKGDGVFVVKVHVPPGTNKEKIHSEFTQEYEQLKFDNAFCKGKIEGMNEQSAIHRADMMACVETLAKAQNNHSINQSIQVNNEAKATAEGKVMNESTDQNRKIEIGSVGRDFNASGQALNLGSIDISGTVTNTIGQLQESNASEASQLADLLKQLQAAIEKEENLNEEDKSTALEQVKVLAEAGQKPKEGATQKAAKTAMTMLKGTITGLPATASLFEACSKLLPLITKLFGLG